MAIQAPTHSRVTREEKARLFAYLMANRVEATKHKIAAQQEEEKWKKLIREFFPHKSIRELCPDIIK
jgi:L-rhamnose mutarotase